MKLIQIEAKVVIDSWSVVWSPISNCAWSWPIYESSYMSQYIFFLPLKPVWVRFLASVTNRVLINIRVIRERRKKRRGFGHLCVLLLVGPLHWLGVTGLTHQQGQWTDFPIRREGKICIFKAPSISDTPGASAGPPEAPAWSRPQRYLWGLL